MDNGFIFQKLNEIKPKREEKYWGRLEFTYWFFFLSFVFQFLFNLLSMKPLPSVFIHNRLTKAAA